MALVPVPPGVVTETVTGPATWDGVLAVMVVGLVTLSVVAATVANVSEEAYVRLAPVTVTAVPPVPVPAAGVTDVMVGAGWTNVNDVVDVADPPGVVTEIVTGPYRWALVVALIWVGLVTVKLAAAVVPKVTAVAVKWTPEKWVPVIVTAVPPVVDPVFGETLLTVGVAM